jgi:phytoene synthase
LSDSAEHSESGTDSRAGPAAHCAAQAREFDRDRYLAALFAPDEVRPDLFALYAFNLEIAKIREIVSEPMLGRMRLQWWRDAIDAVYDGAPHGGAPPHHPVALALAEAIPRHELSRHLFERLIQARELELEETGFATLSQLVAYAEGSSGALSQLAIQTLGGAGEDAQTAARHAGIAWGLAGLLRAVPFHAAQRRCTLPRDLLESEGLGAGDLFLASGNDGLNRVVARIALEARSHIAAARELHALVPPAARAALLPLVLADADLARLARRNYDPFRSAVHPHPLPRQLRLATAALLRRY